MILGWANAAAGCPAAAAAVADFPFLFVSVFVGSFYTPLVRFASAL